MKRFFLYYLNLILLFISFFLLWPCCSSFYLYVLAEPALLEISFEISWFFSLNCQNRTKHGAHDVPKLLQVLQ